MEKGNVRIEHRCYQCGDAVVTYHSILDYREYEIFLTALQGLCTECGGNATLLADNS